jgi:hypothetical protein
VAVPEIFQQETKISGGRRKENLFLAGFPPRCRLGPRSSAMLQGAGYQLVTDVSGSPIGPIFKDQLVQ